MSTNSTGARPFSFDYLWEQALKLNVTNPHSPLIYHPLDNQSRLTFTYEACVRYCGNGYTLYSRQDVYDQVLLWRIPLVALLATATLPALGLSTKFFTILHLVADPIDALWSLFYKLQLAQRQRAWAERVDRSQDSLFTIGSEKAQEQNQAQGVGLVDRNAARPKPLKNRAQTMLVGQKEKEGKVQALRNAENKRIKQFDLDVIALVVNAYQEWHYGEKAKQVLMQAFDSQRPYDLRNEFRDRCARAAAFIAADRVSRSFPSVVATLVFFFQIASGFWKTLASVGDSYQASNPSSLDINRTPFNLAFGTLYFWLPFAILATAYVGSANTRNSVVRILERLRYDAKEMSDECHDRYPNLDLPELEFEELRFDMKERWSLGGLPTWQPDKFNDWENDTRSLIWAYFFSGIIVAGPAAAAMWVCWRTPTEGLGCRGVTLISFLASWFVSHLLDWLMCFFVPKVIFYWRNKKNPNEVFWASGSEAIYWICFVKDFILGAGAVTLLTWISLGLFNNCNCWTQWYPNYSERYISFPEESFVFDQIKHRLQWEYAPIIGGVLAFEVILFTIVAVMFSEGHRVLKQQDLEKTLAPEHWYQKFTWSSSHEDAEDDPLRLSPIHTNTLVLVKMDSNEPQSWWTRRYRSIKSLFSHKRESEPDETELTEISQATSTSNQPNEMSGAIQSPTSPTDASGPRQRVPTVLFDQVPRA